jgi:6-phosphogluconolactonase
MRWTIRAAALVALALAGLTLAAGSAAAKGAKGAGAVYTSTNAADGNEVKAFQRAGDGSLKPGGTFSTDGLGSGGGLGNQGAIALAKDRLYVVNAGSDEISAFAIRPSGLRLLGTTPSGGDQPISLTVHRDLLYVLNAGGPSITGFEGAKDGELTPLDGSTQPLTGAGPAQVQFSNDGGVLVATNKETNAIDTFVVGDDGTPAAAVAHDSEGETPFGFDFDKRGHLIVSEAFGGAPGASAVSSYSVAADGGLETISPSVADNEAAACWIEVTKNGRFAYTTNTGSGSVSSYTIDGDGSIELLEQVAADTGAGSAPTDIAQAQNGRVMTVLLPGTHAIASYRVNGNGALSLVDEAGGVAGTATGLAAR